MAAVLLQVAGGYDIAVALIAIMLSLAGMALGIGYAIDDRKLKELGRSEIYQAMISGAIVGALLLAFSSYGPITLLMNSLVSGLGTQQCGQSFPNNYAICFAYNYLMGSASVSVNGHIYPSLMTSTVTLLTAVTLVYVLIGTLSSIKVTILVLSIGLQGLSVFLGPLKATADFLAFSVVVIVAQASVLKFIYLTATGMILPVGIVLRTFYFTRRLGGAIIAIAIGLFAVLPLTYAFNAQLMDSYASAASNQTINATLRSLNSLSTSAVGIENSTSLASNGIASLNPIVGVQSMLSGLSKAGTYAIEEMANAITLLLIQVFFLPTFSLVLTAVSTREMARVLGSEVSFGVFEIM